MALEERRWEGLEGCLSRARKELYSEMGLRVSVDQERSHAARVNDKDFPLLYLAECVS
jgi:hypothetical protein